MTARELLELFRQHAVGVVADGDTLRLKAPRGFLTPELRAALALHKQELLAILADPDSTHASTTHAGAIHAATTHDGTAAVADFVPDASDAVIPRRPAAATVLPLSYSQRQLWFLDQLAPGNPFYNNPAALSLHGPLDIAALERAFTEVATRHEALRTVFQTAVGEPRQVIRPPAPVPLPVTDLSALPEPERRERASRAAQDAAQAPFDLATGPLLRASLLRLAPDEHHLLLNVHHIVADGWSIGILLGEVAASYAAAAAGDRPSLPELPVQYADYALWQAARLGGTGSSGDEPDGGELTGGELGRQLRYWTGRLAGAPSLLALPTDRPRPAVQRFRGAYHHVTVDAEVYRELRAVAQSGDGTLFMALLAALSVLLWRYSGQQDVCIGTPFANRDRTELEGLIGHFINTVVIRDQLDPRRGFAALLAQVREHVLDAYAHPDLPFDQLVEALAPERHTSYSPLFQVMLVMQNLPGGGLKLPGLTAAPLPSSTRAARFDLAMEAVERADLLRLTFEYNTDLFDPGTIALLAEHFTRLLAQVAADPARPVGDLELLSPAERERVVWDWNDTAAPPGGPASLTERFEAQVRERPGQPAVTGNGQTLDYTTLNDRAGALAAALIARGAGPGQVVGLYAGRTPDLIVGILGILKAGAAYLPLDPVAPPERLAAMVADADPALVLTDAAPSQAAPSQAGPGHATQGHAGSDQAGPGGTLFPPAAWLPIAAVTAEARTAVPAGAAPDPAVPVHPASLAYVIYTSGSTGRPKGVAVSHGCVTNLLDNWLTRMGALPGEPAMLWSSVGFDVSIQEIFLPLTTGGVLHLVPEKLRADPAALTGWMAEQRIAHAYLPPAFVRWIDEAPGERLAGLALRQLLVGVEPLSEAGLRRAEQALPGLRVLNGYGPTEATNYCTQYTGPGPADRTCPIGRPIANTRIYLLDDRGEPVPVGVTGEIHIGGNGVARGYLHQPAATAARFVPDPFIAGQRVYRTGDLARYLPDGNIEFLGRGDDQVKLRGFRIEPAEVEAALRAEPDVRDAAVLVDHEDGGEARLIAAISRGDAPPRLASEWREILSPRLPGYMIPAMFAEVSVLPRTANGKLDRAALLATARAQARLQVNQASPRDQIELTLYQLWKRILLHPDIGIGDNFFDIGGTSISAIKLAHAIGEEYGQTLPVRDVMLYPTIEALGGRLRRGASGKPPSNLIEFRAGAGRERVICVHPAGGTGFCYLSLAKVLPESCGVYGIQSPGVNPGESFLPTIEAMAQSYLALTRDLQDGPVLLTGLSYGGLIAYEMGRLLAQAGHDQLSVVLLDTLGTDDPAARSAISGVDMAEFRDKLVKFNGTYPGIDDRQIEQYFHIYNHNRLTMRDYLVPPGSARLVLLQATANRDEWFLREIREFWARRVPGELVVEFTHRDHWELLETDEVGRVAALFESELDRFRPALSGSARSGSARYGSARSGSPAREA